MKKKHEYYKSLTYKMVNSQYETNRVSIDALPLDPLYINNSQWHLGFIGDIKFSINSSADNKAGIEKIWQDYQGDGVAIGIWDDGIQRTHWDLSSNYDASQQIVVSGTLNDGLPLTANDGHGTSVAGILVADDNERGGVGIAPDAKITAIRIFGGADDINNYWSRYLLTLDNLGLFEVTNHSYGALPSFYVYGDVAKFEAAAIWGRGGLGTVNVKSAGNNNIDGNGDALDASRFTVSVAALSYSTAANAAWYSSYGAHVLVSAPAASVTTDLIGLKKGYDGLLSGDYTNIFGGTSASGPVTAGVITLMLDANPGLGWRDVQNILAYSAIGVGSRYTAITTNENFSWKWNGATNWNGGGLHFSEDYGYGMVNAFNAVRMAEVWSILYPISAVSANEQVASTGTVIANKSIPDLSTLNFTFNVSGHVQLEHVALTISLTHANFTNLRMQLISPNGTSMSLYNGSSGNSSTSDSTFTYTFGAEGYRNEDSAGQWTLQIQDVVKMETGTLKTVAFSGYGSAASINSVYHYTSEVLQALSATGQSDRITLADTDGGVDWINASAMSDKLVMDLVSGHSSTVGETLFLTLDANTLIENAMGGDGNDQITGNEVNNLIYGLRGDDELWGGDGIDMAGFRGYFDEYTITELGDALTVSGPDGTDQLSEFEYLRFDNFDVEIDQLSTLLTDIAPPTLTISAPADNATDVAIGANLILTFSEVVKPGDGLISLYDANGLREQWSAAALTFTGQTVVINPAANLDKNKEYYVLVDSSAILDRAGNAFSGISANTTFNFKTENKLNLINGTSKNNSLIGTWDNDAISGLGGNDYLNGKLGMDVLTGGPGKDNFAFDTAFGQNNIDNITDFNVRDDSIYLENAIFTKLSKTGTLNRGFFAANSTGTANDSNDYVLFNTQTGELAYDPDGSGVALSQPFAVFTAWTGVLNYADFVVV